MFYFTDIHSHTLSRVDDGAKNSAMMKKMIDIAYKDGIRTICFSPHFKIYEFHNDNEILLYNKGINQSFELACEYVSTTYPDMQLYLGNEIMYHDEMFSSLSSGFCKTINGSHYALIEFSPFATEREITNSATRALRKGYIPIIAHIERYECLVKNPDIICDLKQNGALMQVNAKSITSFPFSKTKRFINLLLNKKWIDVVATDSHDDKSFSPILSKAAAYVAKKCGIEYTKKIFCDTPNMIISDNK